MYSIYMHTCPNSKKYIGMTSRKPEQRWSSRYANNKAFTEAIEKYGWNSIKHEILFTCQTKEEAMKKEIEMIAIYKSNDNKYGYNISCGGAPTNGIIHSDETKNKIRNSLLGIAHTKERRIHESEAKKRQWEDESYRKKMSLAHIGKQSGKNKSCSKTVYQYSLSKDLIAVFDSVGIAEKETGIKHQQISDCCRKKQKTCHGYLWTYDPF